MIAELFPGLWEFYVQTARSADQFFGATGGAGYAFPWVMENPDAYFAKAAELSATYMPDNNWIVSACPVDPSCPFPCSHFLDRKRIWVAFFQECRML